MSVQCIDGNIRIVVLLVSVPYAYMDVLCLSRIGMDGVYNLEDG